jgi:exonuclease SbcD
MKLIHTADLHLGRQFYGVNILPDQEHILKQIVQTAILEHADGVILAGDIYDTSVASRDAVELLNRFLTRLSRENIAVFMISGNHDSPERIHYGSSLMDKSGIYISGIYDQDRDVKIIQMQDSYGEVRICLLPYIDPATVRNAKKFESAITTFDEAVRTVIGSIPVEKTDRCILVAHQLFSGNGESPVSSESERVIVGGLETVDTACLEKFEYVALGHLHTPQKAGNPRFRYAGSPLRYSPSEITKAKSVTVIELAEKGTVTIREVPLTPLRDLRIVAGTFAELMEAGDGMNDYFVIRITDPLPPPDAMQHLRTVYPNLISLEFTGIRTGGSAGARLEDLRRKTDFELFSGFFSETCRRTMTAFQERIVADILLEMTGEMR